MHSSRRKSFHSWICECKAQNFTCFHKTNIDKFLSILTVTVFTIFIKDPKEKWITLKANKQIFWHMHKAGKKTRMYLKSIQLFTQTTKRHSCHPDRTRKTDAERNGRDKNTTYIYTYDITKLWLLQCLQSWNTCQATSDTLILSKRNNCFKCENKLT